MASEPVALGKRAWLATGPSGVAVWLKTVRYTTIFFGRIGAFAVGLGIGAAVATGTATIAVADTAGSDSSNSSVAHPPASPSAADRQSSGRSSTAPTSKSAVSRPDPRAQAAGIDPASVVDSNAGGPPGADTATRAPRSTKLPAPPAAAGGTASSYVTDTDGRAIGAAPAKAIPTSDRRVGLANAHVSRAVANEQFEISARSPGGSGLSTSTALTPEAQNVVQQSYFPAAKWLWQPIASDPVIAANSALWVSYLSAAGTQHVADLYEYSVTLVPRSSVTRRTPRYRVNLTANWGPNPFGSYTVPIPKGTRIPPGSDGQIAILDPTTGKAFSIWQAKYNSKTNTWSGSWGGMTAISGNGIDTSGSGTGAGISRYAGVITAAEFSAAVTANTGLSHALVVSSNIAGPGFVGPATKSDGTNIAGVATPIPEGYRIQLDPSIDVDAIPGITPAERVIAKTLQTYGAYVVDQGGAALAFAFEMQPDATSASNPGAVWSGAGLKWDYYDMAYSPWTQLRVIAA